VIGGGLTGGRPERSAAGDCGAEPSGAERRRGVGVAMHAAWHEPVTAAAQTGCRARRHPRPIPPFRGSAARLGGTSPGPVDAMTTDSQPVASADARRDLWPGLRRQAARRPMLVLVPWTAAWFVILARRGGIAWIFFVKGSALLFTGHFAAHSRPGGMRLYASYPGLQIGPLSFVVAEAIRKLGPDQGLVLAQIILSVIGLLTLMTIRSIAVTARPELIRRSDLDWTFLAGGAVFMTAWTELAVAYGHLDDALALLLAALALWAAITGHPALTGLGIGLAADAKPWALIFLPVLLLSAGTRRWRAPDQAARPVRASLPAWLVASACAAAVIAAAWLPFFVAVPETARALHYTIGNLPDSALRALGVSSPRTPPWDRAAQICIACVLGIAAIWRNRWPGVLLLGAGARIALDPGAHGYYTPSIMVGALIWDLLGARRPLPVWTMISFFALNLVPLLTADGPIRGAFRLYLVVAFTLAVLLGPQRWVWAPTQILGPVGADPAEPAAHEGPPAPQGAGGQPTVGPVVDRTQ
jgi:hypothetical protein